MRLLFIRKTKLFIAFLLLPLSIGKLYAKNKRRLPKHKNIFHREKSDQHRTINKKGRRIFDSPFILPTIAILLVHSEP